MWYQNDFLRLLTYLWTSLYITFHLLATTFIYMHSVQFFWMKIHILANYRKVIRRIISILLTHSFHLTSINIENWKPPLKLPSHDAGDIVLCAWYSWPLCGPQLIYDSRALPRVSLEHSWICALHKNTNTINKNPFSWNQGHHI